jgi:hypothetical protein
VVEDPKGLGMTHVSATFSIAGSGYAEGELNVDPARMSPEYVAEVIANRLWPGVTLCHQCDGEISDPEMTEVTSFTIGEKTWSSRTNEVTGATEWFLES